MSGIVVFGLYFLLKAVPRSNSTLLDILTLVVQVSLGIPVAIGFWIYNRNFSAGLPLLWLRRFRPSDRGKYRFQHVLKGATRGVFSPITIQDQSYRSSYLPGLLHPLVAPSIALLGIFGLLPVAVPLAAIGATAGQFAAAAAIWFMLTAIIGYRIIRRLGYSSFAGDRGLAKAAARLLRARQGGLGAATQSVDVWKCSNENWQAIVRIGVEAADIVLVDLSNINDNIRWEIQQVRNHKIPASIVWVAENGSKIDRDLLLEMCSDYQVQPGDSEALARAGGLFVYPSRPLRYGVPRHYLNQSKGLRALLLSRLPALPQEPPELETLRLAEQRSGAGFALVRRIGAAVLALALLGTGIVWLAQLLDPVLREPVLATPSAPPDTMPQPAAPKPALESLPLLDAEALTQLVVGRWRYVMDTTTDGDMELAADGSMVSSARVSGQFYGPYPGRWRINPLGDNRFELIKEQEGKTYVNVMRALSKDVLLYEPSSLRWQRR